MTIYDKLLAVAETAKPFAGGSQITPENRDQAVKEMQDLVFAATMASRAGAIRYDLEQAVCGRVSQYLREENR